MTKNHKSTGVSMAAEKGNKYSQKYTREDVIRILCDIRDGIQNYREFKQGVRNEDGSYMEENVIVGYQDITQGLRKNGVTRFNLRDWKEKTYSEDEEVSHLITYIKELAKDFRLEGVLTGRIPQSIGRMLLTNDFGYSEKQHHEVVSTNTNYNAPLSVEEAKRRLDSLESEY